MQFTNHRQNLRRRFLISKESLPDYELLEMLLFFAIPRKDTKPLAKMLLKKFGNLDGVINADKDQLLSIDGVGEATINMLQLIHEILVRISLEDIKKHRLVLDNSDKVEKYCRTRIGHMVKEEMLVLFFNGAMELINEEIVNTGNHSEVKVYKNMIVTKATQNGAFGVILVHNHPSSNFEPSLSDIKITKELKVLLDQLELRLFDHIIVFCKGSFSFSKNKLIVGDFLL